MEEKKKGTEMEPVRTWGPFSMMDEMDRFLRDRVWDAERIFWPNFLVNLNRVPAVDVREERDRFVLLADMPGMSKEDVNIEVGDDVIEISAEKEQNSEVEEEGYIRRERGSMMFHRRLMFPENVDRDGITAKLTDGVLEVTLPKKAPIEPQKKKVDVQ